MPGVVGAITGALTAALGGGAAAAAIATAVVQLGGSLLLSYASRALMPKPKLGLTGRTVTVREPVRPRDLVYGRARKGGTIVFLHSSGENRKFLHLVIVLAAHPVQSIGAVYFDGQMAVAADGTVQDRWENRVLLQKRLGDVPQAPFDFGAGTGTILDGFFDAITKRFISGSAKPGAERPEWGEDHRLDGCAAIYLRLRYSSDKFPGGIPNITVDIEGKNDILDPRTDTRGYSENAALCLADYMADPVYGLGAAIGAADGVDEDDLIAAANICDETVELDEETSEPRYTCNGVVDTSQSPQTIIQALLTAMAGRAAHHAGRWHLHAGAHVAPDLTLTPSDATGQGLSIQTLISRADLCNGVRGQFVSPENDWQPDDFPALQSAAYVAEDGGEAIWRDISLPYTISATAAQRLAKIELERTRRQITVRWPGRLAAWRAVTGGTLAVTDASWGWTDKPFEVQGMTLSVAAGEDGGGPVLVPDLVLRETSPLVYSWEATEAQIYAAAPRTELPGPFDVAAPGVPALAEELYATRDSAGVKSLIRATWEAAPSEFALEYQVEARRRLATDGTATGDDWRTLGRTDQLTWEIRDTQPGTWDVRVKAISAAGVSSAYAERAIEALGLSAPPAALTGVTLQSAGGLAILKWQTAPDLDVRIGGRIVIRHTVSDPPAWASSVQLDSVPGGTAIAVVPLKPGTYLLAAVDAGGIRGPEVAVAASGAQAVAFSAVGTLQEDDEFTGGKTNVELDGATLILTDPGLGEGTYVFDAGLDLGSVKVVRLRSHIRVAAENLAALVDSDELVDSLTEDWDGTEGADVDVVVEARTTPDDPGGSPAWSGWSRIDSSEVEARGIECRARLLTASENFNLRLTELRVTAEEVA